MAILDAEIVVVVVKIIPAVRRANDQPVSVGVVRAGTTDGITDQLVCRFGNNDLNGASRCSREDLNDISRLQVNAETRTKFISRRGSFGPIMGLTVDLCLSPTS